MQFSVFWLHHPEVHKYYYNDTSPLWFVGPISEMAVYMDPFGNKIPEHAALDPELCSLCSRMWFRKV